MKNYKSGRVRGFLCGKIMRISECFGNDRVGFLCLGCWYFVQIFRAYIPSLRLANDLTLSLSV